METTLSKFYVGPCFTLPTGIAETDFILCEQSVGADGSVVVYDTYSRLYPRTTVSSYAASLEFSYGAEVAQ